MIFTFYVLTFFIDLLPAARNKQPSSNVGGTEMGLAEGAAQVAYMQPGGQRNGPFVADFENHEPTRNGSHSGNMSGHPPQPLTSQNF